MRRIVAVLAALLFLSSCGAALEGEIFSLQESQLFLDPGPGIALVPQGSNLSQGILSHEYALLAEDDLAAGYAYLSVAAGADRYLRLIDPDSMVRLIAAGALESLQEEGVVEVGNWSATSSLGQPVDVHVLGLRSSGAANQTWEEILAVYPAGQLAVWDLGNYQYAVLLSFFNQSTAQRVVETLAIR